MSNTSILIGTLIRLCDRLTISIGEDSSDMIDVSKTVLITCMKFVDREKLFTSSLLDKYVDWSVVPNTTAKTNLLGESPVWLEFVKFLDFGELLVSETIMQNQHPPLWCIYNSLKHHDILSTPSTMNNISGTNSSVESTVIQKLTFDDACKLCLLNNIIGLSSKTITDQYLSYRLKKSTFSMSSTILSALADERHSTDVYLKTMQYLLSLLTVKHAELHTNVLHFRQHNKVMKAAMLSKYSQNSTGRPSMLRVAKRYQDGQLLKETQAMGSTSSELQSISPTTFEQYGVYVRFSNSTSILKRLRCYLLGCMTHQFDISHHMLKIVTKDVADKILTMGSIIPHQESVSIAIQSLAMNRAPFAELNLFRDSCFSYFSINQRMNINLTQVLHLYIAAYQRKDIWKECWKSVYPIMSSQISKSVEQFVLRNPLPIDTFMHLISTNIINE